MTLLAFSASLACNILPRTEGIICHERPYLSFSQPHLCFSPPSESFSHNSSTSCWRQLAVLDLGHDDPTVLVTNDRRAPAAKVILRYAQRMLIENALADAVRFFHMDALSSAVGLKVDFDMALLVIASGLYRLLARTMRGYADAQARQIFRDLIDMPATVEVTAAEVVVQFHRRAHLPIVVASGLLNTPVRVPWWNGVPLRLTG